MQVQHYPRNTSFYKFHQIADTLPTGWNGQEMRAAVKAAPQTSLQYASSLHFSLSAVHRMLKYDLGHHPYKLQIVQQMKEPDFAGWTDFYKQFSYLQFLEDMELTVNWMGV